MVRQGDVTDPNYFDTLSLAQYKTIGRSVAQPVSQVFTEEQPIRGDGTSNTDALTTQQRFQSVLVRRVWSDKELVPLFDRFVGESILTWISDRYGTTDIGLPSLSRDVKETELYAGLQQLVKLFVLNGFAWEGRVEPIEQKASSPSASFRLILTSPATAYSSRILAAEDQRRTGITNDFLGKTAQAWIGTSNQWTVSKYKVELPPDGSEETYLTVVQSQQLPHGRAGRS